MAFLVRAYLFIGLLAGAAYLAPQINSAWLFAVAMIIAVPATLAMWHRLVVHKLLYLQQFQPGRALHWIGSRLLLGKILGAVFALLLALSAILHASFFGGRDWLLFALMPVVFGAARYGLEALLRHQLTGRMYLSHSTLRLAGWVAATSYLAGWIGLALTAPDAAPDGLLDRVDALQAPWRSAPAALARYAADAIAWVAAAQDAADGLSQVPAWRVALGVVIAPLATIVFVALAMQGLSLPQSEVRRCFSSGLSGAGVPPPITSMGAGTHAAVIVVILLILLSAAAHVEHALQAGESPFAVRRIPECEAIKGKVYKLGTLDSITKALSAGTAELGPARASTCSALDAAQTTASKAVDSYLDWYFSLPAEWMRIAKMLTGGLEQMLADRLAVSIKSEPGLVEALARAQGGSLVQADKLDALKSMVHTILADNVLALDERSCKVMRRDSIAQTLAARESEALRLRTAGSAGAGLVAGAFAGKVAAKAMTKTSMKAAAKVLSKFAAKKAATVSISTGTGMALGSVVPGPGTVAGAVLGAVAGVAISMGVDWAALAAEEHLERNAMKAELLAAFRETLAPTRVAMGCQH